VEANAMSSIERRLSALDASYLYNESARNPLHVGAVLIFEGHIPFDDIVKSIKQRLHVVPRFRQRLVEVPFDLAFPSWEDDPDFQLENHVKRFELPPGTDQQQAIRRVLHEYHPMLQRERPLWEFACFEQWPGKHTALVCKFHHALADGASSVKLIKKLFDFSPEARPPEPPPQPAAAAPLPSPSQRFVSAAHDLAVKQVKSFTDAMVEAFHHPSAFVERNRRLQEAIGKIAGPARQQIVTTPWNTLGLAGVRDLVWLRRSFSEYRAIRDSFGGSTDDVLLTVLTEAAGRYLKHHGYSTDGYFRIARPVNVRQDKEQAECGNRVSMIFPTIPARTMDPVERLRTVCQETGRIKPDEVQTMDRLGLRWTGSLGSNLGAFPTGVFASTFLNEMTPPILAALTYRMELQRTSATAAFIKTIGSPQCLRRLVTPPPVVNFVTSHVASAQAPAYLCGHRCLEQIGVLPVCEGLGYGVLVLSYNQTRCIGMCADLGVMPDLERMKHYVEASFSELKRAAVQKRRRTPIPCKGATPSPGKLPTAAAEHYRASFNVTALR
jgi:diacylglycerol O-acyltransferase / wax synthase